MNKDIELLYKIWQDIGISYDPYARKFNIPDQRRTLGILAKHTNSHGLAYIDKSRKFFTTPSQIQIKNVQPYMVRVEKRKERDLWNYALTYWRIPVSEGVGRRIRFLIFDSSTRDSLIGLLGLSSSMLSSQLRDSYIGWTPSEKKDKIKHLMTAFCLGAVYPYNKIFGTKLIAMLCNSVTVQQAFKRNYSTSSNKQALAAIEAFGSFGESKVFRDTEWQFLGMTRGYSTQHFSHPKVWEIIKRNADPDIIADTNIFSETGNWKAKVIRSALNNMGLPQRSLLNIGLCRSHYFLPLLENTIPYLCNQDNSSYSNAQTIDEIVEDWKEICTKKIHR